MKVSTAIAAFGLFLGVVSEPVARVKRDLATFEGIISDIAAQVDALTSAVNAFSGDGGAVQGASSKLVTIINDGVTKAKSQPQLTQSEALQLTKPVQDLTDKVNTDVDAVIAKKSAFVGAGLGGSIKASLKQQYDAANALADAISGKVPPELAGVAKELSAGIANAIQRGIDAYKDVSDSAPSSTKTSGPTATAQPTESMPTGTTAAPTTSSSQPTAAPTGGYPTGGSGSSSSGVAAPTGTYSASPSTPAFTGAASANKVAGLGGIAIAAAVLAF
jgi:hypothetical protein